MSRFFTRGMAFALLGLLTIAGCSGDKAPPGGGNKAAGQEEAPAKPAETPDAAVLAVINGLKESRPQAVWEFLPGSYQKDVNGLLHAFAERMDGEVWGKSMQVLKKLTAVLKTKKEFLLDVPALKEGGQDVQKLSANWDSLVGILETLTESDFADLEKLQKADGGKILSATGGKLLGQFQAISKAMPDDPFTARLGSLSNVKVSLVASEGDTAKVKIEAPDEETKEIDFVRAEGKWIPKSLADEWVEAIGQAQARLAMLSPESLADHKPQILGVLGGIEQLLDKLSAAKDKQTFQATLQEALPALLAMGMMFAPMGPPAGQGTLPANEPSEFVTVIIRGKLDDEAGKALVAKLLEATDDKDNGNFESTGDDESLTVKIGPVKDIQEFAKKLESLKIVKVDEKDKVITAEIKP